MPPPHGRPAVAALAALLALLAPPAARAGEQPLRQVIDAEVRAAWQREKVAPAGRADDATFLRRVHLDLVGTIPTADEVGQLLQDPAPDKRSRLIDRLLADPRFAAQQADVWDLVLFGRNPANGDATRKRDAFRQWLAGQFARGVPYDRWVRELLLAEQEGTELFYVQFRSQPEEAAVAVSRLFLGTQLQCARCHDHPYEKRTQRDFYGMAGFFVRLVVFDPTGSGAKRRYTVGEKSSGEVLFTGAAKDQKPGRKGEPVRPRFLGGAVLDEPPLAKGYQEPANPKTLPKPAFSRKEKLAAWVVAPFGEPGNGRGEFQGGLSEHLFLNNSGNVLQMVQRRKGKLADGLLASKEPWERRVEKLFLSVLGRPPKAEETRRFVAHLTSDPRPDPLVEDAIWALLNSPEFRFNH